MNYLELSKHKFTYIAVKEATKLSHRQKQRSKKRILKNEQLKEDARRLLKKKTTVFEEQVKLKKVCF